MLRPRNNHLPVKKRACTDIVCTVLFLLVIAFGFLGAGYGVLKGDPNKLATPFDSDGIACGQGTAQDFPFLFYSKKHIGSSEGPTGEIPGRIIDWEEAAHPKTQV